MDLRQISGLGLELDDQGNLHLEASLAVEERRFRRLDELTAVYLDQEACRGDRVAYEMINGVVAAEDVDRLAGLPVRYELTFFPALKIGQEYVKTLGHIHLPERVSGIDHPEICEVLAGRAHFFFMRLNPDGKSAERAFYVELTTGQKIIIPPGYEHLTINPGPGPMLFSDVVARAVGGNYERMKAARGAVYLEVERDQKSAFIPNPHYHSHPTLTQVYPKEFPQIGLVSAEPLYTTFRRTRGEGWEFLWRPETYPQYFPELSSIFNG
jgi:glucose-6-phosphate isomerase, archaeal